MSLAQRFERRLEGLVGGAFARVFKGQVEPVEIGTALQREAADKRNVMGNGRVLSPNRYRVTLSASDYERLVPWESQLTNSLAELVQDSLDENRWEDRHQFLGFGLLHDGFGHADGNGWLYHWELIVPYWFICVLLATPALLSITRRARRRN